MYVPCVIGCTIRKKVIQKEAYCLALLSKIFHTIGSVPFVV